MRFLGYKIVKILEALYKDTISAMRVDTELSEWFLTVIRVMQECVSEREDKRHLIVARAISRKSSQTESSQTT